MQTYFICRHLKSGVNTSRFISGSLLQSTNIFDCCNTLLGIEGMLSALSQIILANVTFLISCSWHCVKAVLSVSRLRFGAFSCQKRSPSRRRLNCSANKHWKVFPSAPPSASAGSSIPVKNHENNTCYKRNPLHWCGKKEQRTCTRLTIATRFRSILATRKSHTHLQIVKTKKINLNLPKLLGNYTIQTFYIFSMK